MGIRPYTYGLMNEYLKGYDQDSVILELGQTETSGRLPFKYLRDDLSKRYKNYFTVDLTPGDNITKLDLSKYSPNRFKADVILNFGTSPHVEYQNGQYNCWLNMHHWLKYGGIIIHDLPVIGTWRGCRYFPTETHFRKMQYYGCKILHLEINRTNDMSLMSCVVKKIRYDNFMSKRQFYVDMIFDNTIKMSEIDKTNNPKSLK